MVNCCDCPICCSRLCGALGSGRRVSRRNCRADRLVCGGTPTTQEHNKLDTLFKDSAFGQLGFVCCGEDALFAWSFFGFYGQIG